jgi:cytochrome c oxidase cbb3-type subunit 3
MSNAWAWFVLLGTVISMLACFWLIAFSNRQRQSAEEIAESEAHVWDEDVRELNNPLPRWWLWLFIGTLLWGAGYLLYYPGLVVIDGFGNWSQEARYEAEMAAAEERYAPIFARFADMNVEQLLSDPKAMSLGQSLFANYCAQCHGSGAQGAPGFPTLTDDEWLWGGSPAQIEQAILKGRSGVMPALGPALGGESEIDAMVDYVLAIQDGQDTASPAHAKYMMLCVACHGPDGTGNPVLGAPSLANDQWLYGSSESAIRSSISNGRNGVMPGHEALIGPDRARILAAYVYSLSR